jgi:hypothetical protein
VGKKFYMVGVSAVRWEIRIVRNRVACENYILRSPLEAVFTMCSFLLYWAGLQTSDGKNLMIEGTRKMKKLLA